MSLTLGALAGGTWAATKLGAFLYGAGAAISYAWDKAKPVVYTWGTGRAVGGKEFWPFLLDLGKDFALGNITPEKGDELIKLITGALPSEQVNKAIKGIAEGFSQLSKNPGEAIKGIMAGLLELIKCIREYFCTVSSEGRIMLNAETAQEKEERLAKEKVEQDKRDAKTYVTDITFSDAINEQTDRNKRTEEVLGKLDSLNEFTNKHPDASINIVQNGLGLFWYDYDLEVTAQGETVSVPLKDVKEVVENYHENQIFDLEKTQHLTDSYSGVCECMDVLRAKAASTNDVTKQVKQKVEAFMKRADEKGFTQMIHDQMEKIRDTDFQKLGNGIIEKWATQAIKEIQRNAVSVQDPKIWQGFIKSFGKKIGLDLGKFFDPDTKTAGQDREKTFARNNAEQGVQGR